jgi:hypothetical protein
MEQNISYFGKRKSDKMSVKKAQSIVNEVEGHLGITLVAFNNDEIEWLKSKLEEFLDLEINTDDLQDPEDCEQEDEDE